MVRAFLDGDTEAVMIIPLQLLNVQYALRRSDRSFGADPRWTEGGDVLPFSQAVDTRPGEGPQFNERAASVAGGIPPGAIVAFQLGLQMPPRGLFCSAEPAPAMRIIIRACCHALSGQVA